MSKGGYKIDNQFQPHFLTFQVVYWIDIFTRQIFRDVLLDSLRFYQKNQGLKVNAYVIMSNHAHFILTASQPKHDLSSLVGRIKSYSSRKMIESIKNENESRREWLLRLFEHAAKKHNRNTQYQIWTHNNHPVELHNNEIFTQRLNYIHENPVRAGLVTEPEHYLYSSASNYAGMLSVLDVEYVL